MSILQRALQFVVKENTRCLKPKVKQCMWLSSVPTHHQQASAPVPEQQNISLASSQVSSPAVALSNEKLWKATLEESLRHPDYFQVTDMFTVEDLFKARLHIGHTEGTLNEYMVPYLFGSRLSQLIIDLDQTTVHLRKALNFLAHMAFRDGMFLFVCRHKQYQHMIEEVAARCGEFSHNRWWAGGILTNSEQQFKCTIRLPDTVVLLSTHNHILDKHIAVNDSAKMLIPTVGVVDTNSDPRIVTYPVPASDDSMKSVEYLTNLFADAIMKGKNRRKEIRGEQGLLSAA